VSALARLQGDREKLSRACSDAMIVQVLAVGPVLLLFGVLAPIVLQSFMGAKWTGAFQIYPWIALSAIVDAVFSFHPRVLNVLDRNWDVALFQGARVAIFCAAAIPLLPAHGLQGYGYAESLTFVAYLLVHACIARQGVRPSYLMPLVLMGAFGVAVFFRELGWPVALVPLLTLAWPDTWRLASRYRASLAGVA
jgi:O-antigen/teichoic acid export membrane protein